MKKLFLLTLLSSLIWGQSFAKYSGGGALNSLDKKKYSSKKTRVSKKRGKRFTSPVTEIAVGTSVKMVKGGNFGSLKSKNYYKVDENQVSYSDQPGLYSDFDEIYKDGKYVGYYKIGNPYKIEGILYYPQEYEDYEEVGTASWYGEKFDGKMTANGEIYNLGAMTAAHQTLPLPSIVKVTNLQNGRFVKVRVNDRGPFAKSRIIDLSKRAAGVLGYRDNGTATVKVEYLPEETEKMLKKLKIR